MKHNRILVVDDEQHIADVVVYVLEQNGYEVLTALDGEIGLKVFEEKHPDLVVLDLNLPALSGMNLFQEMRRLCPKVPIVMLTSRSEEVDRVVGLEIGADDYVTKPFSPRELAARVRAVLRRSDWSATDPPKGVLQYCPVEFDSLSFCLTYFGTRLHLTRPEFRLIESLLRYPARVFTRDMLISTIYDGHNIVTDRSVDAYVKRIRRKFVDVRPELDPIQTVYGLGYKLNQDLEGAA